MKILCLLPVRNGELDLPDYFESAARFADAVVALDDGSTDATRALLERQPLVAEVLTNPVRHDFRGWHDAENRNRLLAAAGAHRPDWIISIDADERIDAGDASALRAFLAADALPGIGYGFRCYSMTGDLRHAVGNPIWVYRLFAYRNGQRFPNQQLHFAPIPTEIPRRAFLRTTFRIQHLGGMSAERRLARYEKYRQADPACRFWPDYTGLLNEPDPAEVIEWLPREPSWPAIVSGEGLLGPSSPGGTAGAGAGNGGCSVIVLDGGATTNVRRALASVDQQAVDRASREIILVTSEEQDSAPGGARVVRVPRAAKPGAMRNAGIAAASSGRVLFLDGDMELLPGALQALSRGFEQGFAAVTGGIEDRSGGAANATFEDRFRWLRAGRSEAILERPVAWAAYSTTLFDDLGGFDESLPAGEDELFGRRVAEAGYVTLRLGQPVLAYYGESASPRSSGMRSALARGRADARYRLSSARDRGEVLLSMTGRGKVGRPRPGWDVRTARRAGLWSELLRPERGKAQVLLGRPGGVALIAGLPRDSSPRLALVRFRLTVPDVRVVALPPDLRVPGADGGQTTLAEALFPTGWRPVDRFTVNDAVGRPFRLRIDDIVFVDGRTRPGNLLVTIAEAVVARDGEGKPDRAARYRAITAAWLAAARGGEAMTSFGRIAVSLALLQLARLDAGNYAVIRPFSAGEVLDDDGVDLVTSFLGADDIARPRTKRDSLRDVEWA